MWSLFGIEHYLDYTEPLFRPPAEARSLIIQLTQGCSHNRCRFCGMYKGKEFRINDSDKIQESLHKIPAEHKMSVDRIFLADGDALVCEFRRLERFLELLNHEFPMLKRVSVYATPKNVHKFNHDELLKLKRKKLWIAYLGLESGDDRLLAMAEKGNTAKEFVQACHMLRDAGIKTSVTAILGLGGKKVSKKHAMDTAEAVNQAEPNYFSLLTLLPGNNQEYLQSIELMSRYELLQELRMLIERLEAKTVFRTNHVSNFVDLSGNIPRNKAELLALIDAILDKSRDDDFFRQIPQFDGEYSY